MKIRALRNFRSLLPFYYIIEKEDQPGQYHQIICESSGEEEILLKAKEKLGIEEGDETEYELEIVNAFTGIN